MLARLKRVGRSPLSAIHGPRLLRSRLMALLGIIIVGIMLVMSTSIYYIASQDNTSDWQVLQGEAARSTAGIVSAFLKRAEDSLSLINLLDPELLSAKPEIVRSLFLQNESLLEVVRLDSGGHVLANVYQGSETVLGSLFTIPQSQWFVQARAGKPYFGRIQISSMDRPYVLLALPASDGGVVAARLSMDVLSEVVNNISFGHTGRSFVVSHNGDIIAYTRTRTTIDTTTLMGNPVLESVLASPNNRWYGEYTNLEGIQVTGTTIQVPGTDWIVFNEVMREESYQSSTTSLRILLLGLLVLSVLAMWASSRFLESLILHPISRLREGAERIGSGELTYRIGLENADEIGVVASSFDRMAGQLIAQVAEVAARKNELEDEVEVRKKAEEELRLTQEELEIRIEQRTAELVSTNRKLVGLNQVSHELIRLAEPNDILEMASTAISQILDTDWPLVALVDPSTQQISFPVPTTDGSQADYDELVRYVCHSAAPLLLSLDVKEHLVHLGIMVNGEPLKSLLAVPMLAGGRVLGVILLRDGKQAGKYNLIDQELCVSFAAQAVIALENARLFKAAQREIAERTQAEIHTHEALVQKEVLLKEVHHRVKNNLQVISSLLNLQAVKISDPATMDALRTSQNRVRSMALVHEKLYQSNDLAHVDFGSYLLNLTNSLLQTYRVRSENVTIKVDTDQISLNIDAAIPCGLIVNELVSNSLKYAYPGDAPGTILVTLRRTEDGRCRLVVRDDGVGLPSGLDISRSQTLGLSLVSSLVKQIQGELAVDGHQGTRFEILFMGSYGQIK